MQTPAETDARPREEVDIHTRMLRIGLAAEDSRAYWEQAGRELPPGDRVRVAFEERWFGSRSMARVKYLVTNFSYRYDAFPEALRLLHRWNPTDLRDRTLLCHWHVQLSDPLYREFTSAVFAQRRIHPEPSIDRTTVVRWVEQKLEGRWSRSTSQRMASGLLGCATEAGLCEGTKAARPLRFPRVSDQALGYLLYLLREVEFEGTLRDNPYMVSVGLDEGLWEQRVRRLPWVRYRRVADVHDLRWEFANLRAWAEVVGDE